MLEQALQAAARSADVACGIVLFPARRTPWVRTGRITRLGISTNGILLQFRAGWRRQIG
jgi:hypothetical protein